MRTLAAGGKRECEKPELRGESRPESRRASDGRHCARDRAEHRGLTQHSDDVLAGATLGYVVGHSVARSNGLPARGREPRFDLTPSTDASGGGVGAGFSYSW